MVVWFMEILRKLLEFEGFSPITWTFGTANSFIGSFLQLENSPVRPTMKKERACLEPALQQRLAP